MERVEMNGEQGAKHESTFIEIQRLGQQRGELQRVSGERRGCLEGQMAAEDDPAGDLGETRSIAGRLEMELRVIRDRPETQVLYVGHEPHHSGGEQVGSPHFGEKKADRAAP
jgi:hypothetical protein